MITTIRRFIKSKTAKTILILTIAAVGGVFSIPLLLKKNVGGQWIVTVNGESAPYEKFARKTIDNEERIRAIRGQYGQMADMLLQAMGMALNPQVLAVKQLIQEELLEQLAHELDIHVSDDFLQQSLSDPRFIYQELSSLVPPQLIDPEYGIDMHTLALYLQHRDMSTKDFYNEVEQVLRRSVVGYMAVGSVYEPEWRVRSRYVQKELAKKFSLYTFGLDSYIEEVKKNVITKTELKNYFDNQNRSFKRYWVPEKRTGKVWAFDAQGYGVNVSDDEIKTYYDDYKQKKYIEASVKLTVRKIVIPFTNPKEQKEAFEKARSLHAELLKDSSLFAQKAKEISLDQETAKNGGLMPEFSRGTHAREFEKAAFLLKKDGDISAVVREQDSFMIVRRVKRVPAIVKSFSSVSGSIKNLLIERKFKNKFYKDMKRFLQAEDTTAEDRDLILKKARTVTDSEPKIKDDSKLAKTLFRNKEGSFGFYLEGGKGFVVQTAKIAKRFRPSLEVVKETVEGDMHEELAAKKLNKSVEEAQEELKGSVSADIATMFKAKKETIGMIKFEDSEKLKRLSAKGVPVEQMLMLENIGDVGISVGERTGYLFVLDELESLDEDKFEAKKFEIRKELQLETSQLIVATLVAFLNRVAKIEVNKSIVTINE